MNNEIKRGWKMDKTINDSGKLSEYVVGGATMSCTLGTIKSPLQMPSSHGVFLKGKPQCNITDYKPYKNIISFGVCKRQSPPPACTPAINTPWVNKQDTNLLIDGQKALIKDANSFCALGGIISIEKSGQG
jgi:hypothetical protein